MGGRPAINIDQILAEDNFPRIHFPPTSPLAGSTGMDLREVPGEFFRDIPFDDGDLFLTAQRGGRHGHFDIDGRIGIVGQNYWVRVNRDGVGQYFDVLDKDEYMPVSAKAIGEPVPQ